MLQAGSRDSKADLSLLVAVANLEALNVLKQSGAILSEEEKDKLEDEWYVFCGWICRSLTDDIPTTSSTLRYSIKTLVETIDRLQTQLNQLSRP